MSGLAAAIALVEGQKEMLARATTGFSHRDYGSWTAARRQAIGDATAALEHAGARLRTMPGGETAIAWQGLRSSSTCGLESALANWLRRARERLEGEENRRG